MRVRRPSNVICKSVAAGQISWNTVWAEDDISFAGRLLTLIESSNSF